MRKHPYPDDINTGAVAAKRHGIYNQPPCTQRPLNARDRLRSARNRIFNARETLRVAIACRRQKCRSAVGALLTTGLTIGMFIMLPACAERGDFGRPKTQPDQLTVANFIGMNAANERGEPVTKLNLTPAERQMRRIGFRFLEPLGKPAPERDLLATIRYARYGYPQRPLSDAKGYYQQIRRSDQQSSAQFWNKLTSDINNDHVMSGHFINAAQNVLDADAQRKGLLKHGRGIDSDQIKQVRDRIAENDKFIRFVAEALHDRTAAYRYAAKHGSLEMPAAEGEKIFQILPDLTEAAALIAKLPELHTASFNRPVTTTPQVIPAPLIDLSGD